MLAELGATGRSLPHPLLPRRAMLRAGAAALGASAATASAGRAQGAARPWPGRLILACDQASRSVLLLDEAATNRSARGWARPADLSPLWAWSAETDPQVADLDPQRFWRNVSEAKTVSAGGASLILTCASEGLAAVLRVETGRVAWAVSLPLANLHSMELLPDGNIALAASTAGFVRVYAASQGPRADTHSEVPLPGAHGLHWDANGGLLWALGTRVLMALAVEGSARHPRLTPVRTLPLPEPGGHDLSPVPGAPGRMWLSTRTRVHQFSVRRSEFTPGSWWLRLDRLSIKSVSQNRLTGRILTVSPDPASPCTWCTSRIQFHSPHATAEFAGSSLYKARWWDLADVPAPAPAGAP
ncbi:DUF6528 family protein [Streptomyces sp. H27-C3]|uniref:DUF6528 family protein n=1 Tax=Streptomyces sp. H27-C3 TaxID=3046305 RepID=UPI0032D8CCCA